ncbi:MAG: UDP-N-acetylmuramate:L-alanyl-gamma-D-glutamyl-meso-diaminopimelate ligase [Spirochaetes bacterium]|nr:UDP-N-acetylmuramate:L-alanyl-gamma-D-glutamyl-meso-diaminopimelate ligase [Spirochaetota bacterium]
MAERIHLVGVCGVAMGTLALMLHERGFAVSGSDQNMYPPMSLLLRKSGIALMEGYGADNIAGADLVIVGNALSRGNPEVERVLDSRVPYVSMARALHDYFLRDREVIVVAGTHGKTTTTALLARILDAAGLSPSFFAGGVSRDYDASFRLGTGTHFVVEGDEYDSAFFEKVPKFIFYRPAHAVLTSLEFDHADIYRDLEEIELWFRRLVGIVPANGTIAYSSEYDNLRSIVSASLSKRRSFGGGEADYRYVFRGCEEGMSLLDIETPGGVIRLGTSLMGAYNYANVAAAAAMASALGVGEEGIRKGVETFRGVKRRQELIYEGRNVRIYEDFAHHPTAVRGTLEAMRERYPGARLWAVYEPRSATSRRDVFQEVLPASFVPADVALLRTAYEGSAIRNGRKLDGDRLCRDIAALGRNAHLFPGADDIVKHISENLDPATENVIVIMSNGGFDGIYEKIKGMMDRLVGAGVRN